MQKIKAIKTIEEIPIEKALNLCLQVLKKPEESSQKNWVNQLKRDLETGKKSFRIREIILEKV